MARKHGPILCPNCEHMAPVFGYSPVKHKCAEKDCKCQCYAYLSEITPKKAAEIIAQTATLLPIAQE